MTYERLHFLKLLIHHEEGGIHLLWLIVVLNFIKVTIVNLVKTIK